MKSYNVVIAGAGAAGLIAAAQAAKLGVSVLLIEKKERCGRKIRITGKGRCNITNTKPWQEFSKHIHPKANFFKSAFYFFSNTSTIDFFNQIGVSTVIERGDRVFPESGRAQDVVEKLTEHIFKLGVDVIYNTEVQDVIVKDATVYSVIVGDIKGVEREILCKSLIVATGGLSYPLTGSTGDGYNIAEKLGHTIVTPLPSLTALMPKNYDQELKGLNLKNITASLYVVNDLVQSELGECEFTDNGFEGALGFRLSRKAVKALVNNNKVFVDLDLKPGVTHDQLISRINKEIKEKGSMKIYDVFAMIFPRQLIAPFAAMNSFDLMKRVTEHDDYSIKRIVSASKKWRLEIIDYTGFERCVITAGGVSTDEIISKSLVSRIINNLYFAGEVIDLDADTGGYNLQIAFSTGALAGYSAAQRILKDR